MFGAFESDQEEEVVPSKHSDKKKKNKKSKKHSKRKADEDTSALQAKVGVTLEDKRVRGGEELKNESADEIDDEVVDTEMAMGQQPTRASVVYDEKDYVVEQHEYSNCTVEYVAPASYVRPEFKRPAKKAKQYKFTLDRFQEEAVKCIERNESVLVAAHTSAGKTAIAEYAIAQSLNNRQRVIYTSPIKALSNQKYRELQEEF